MSERDERVEALAEVLHRQGHQGFPCYWPVNACVMSDKAAEHAQALLDSPAMRDLLAEAWDEGFTEGSGPYGYRAGNSYRQANT